MNGEDDVCMAEQGTLSKSDCIAVLSIKHLLIYSVPVSKDTHTLRRFEQQSDETTATTWKSWNAQRESLGDEPFPSLMQHNMREGGVWVKLVCELNTHTHTACQRCWTYSRRDWCCVHRQQDKWLSDDLKRCRGLTWRSTRSVRFWFPWQRSNVWLQMQTCTRCSDWIGTLIFATF